MTEQEHEKLRAELTMAMRQKGLTFGQLATLMSANPSTLARYLQGKTVNPHMTTVIAMCYLLGVDVEWHRRRLPNELAQLVPPSVGTDAVLPL